MWKSPSEGLINIQKLKLDFLVAHLKKGIPFSFARYGDGEWHAILGDEGENCDGHKYFKKMGQELSESLKTPFLHGIIPAVSREIGESRVQSYLESIGLPDKTWCDGNIFVDALKSGELRSLVEVLRTKRFIYVGPRFLTTFCYEVLGVALMIKIPQVNCYLRNQHTETIIREVSHTTGVEVIGFSASMATNCLIANLYPDFGRTTTMLDFGSIFDPFPSRGRRCRNYQKTLDREKLSELNFGG